MIYYDKIETWERSFGECLINLVGREVIESLTSSAFEFIEDAGDHLAGHVDIKPLSLEIHDWLRENEFCVFHGTRLLPYEIAAVQQQGLRPLVAADREQRLREILARHPKWSVLKDKLSDAIASVGPGQSHGSREGQVHFSLSRSGLLSGFNHYLAYGSEFDQKVVEMLFGDQSGLHVLNLCTDPVLFHVRVSGDDLVRGAHPFCGYLDLIDKGEVPAIGRTFLNAWAFKQTRPDFDIAALETDCCLMQEIATPPERILSIEQLADFAAH